MSPSFATSMLPVPATARRPQHTSCQGAAMGIALPSHPREERVPVRNGLQIFIRSWLPPAPPRAIVGIVHGVKSHSGYYDWAASNWSPSGFAVYALDLHGRGKSDGERFYLEQIADYVDDAHTLVTLAKCAASAAAVLPARAQRRRRDLLGLHARAPGGARRLHLRELRLPGLRARLRARRRQGAQPRRPARPRAEAEERGLLARSGGGPGDARRSADRRRSRSRPRPSPSWPAPTSG